MTLTYRFPLVVETLLALRTRSCILDGEAVACGDDLRWEPLSVRKATLASVLAKAGLGLRLDEHLNHEDGAIVFAHACKLGLEGIVSKRSDSPYRSGRSPDWLKMKNPACEAVRREAEEDWDR
jgi:ATP-dependent DNA ligase